MDDEERASALAQIGLAVTAAAVGVAHPDAAPLAEGLAELGNQALARRAQRKGRAFRVAAGANGLDPEEFLERVLRDDRLLLLVDRAVRAAEATAMPEKVDALGAAAGQAVSDPAKIDEESQWVRLFEDIDSEDVRLLRPLMVEDPSALEGRAWERDAWFGGSIAPGVMTPIIARRLLQWGLIAPQSRPLTPDALATPGYIAGPTAPEFFRRLGFELREGRFLDPDAQPDRFDQP